MDFPTNTSTRKSARRSASNLLTSQTSRTSSSTDAASEVSNKEDDAQLETASTISASSVSGSSTRSSSSSKSSSMNGSSVKSQKSKASTGSTKRSSGKNVNIEHENNESSTSKEVVKEESMASNSSNTDISLSSTTITASVKEETIKSSANIKHSRSSIKIEKVVKKINTNVNNNIICQTTASIEAEATSISSEPVAIETCGVGEKRKLSDIDVDVVNDEPKTNSSESNQDETSDSLGPLSSANLLRSDDNSNSQNEASSEPKKKRRRRGSIIGFQEHNSSMPIASVSQLFIYNWPLEEDENGNANSSTNLIYATSPNCYVLQEQISEYLGIKSFKRKYPDIFRRVIDLKEREHLKDNKVVTEAQCDLGLTALRLSECLDIMAEEYHDKYIEFNNYITEKRRRMIAEATMIKNAQVSPEAEAIGNSTSTTTAPTKPSRPPLTEAEKLKEQMRKAMKSASSYNMMLQREKKEERYSYFDIQTMRIQKPLTTKQQNLNTTPQIPNGYYPVSLLQGQFQNYYKKYTNDELKYLPLSTVIETPAIPAPYAYDEWKRSELAKMSKSGINGDKNVENSSDDERVLRMNGITPNQMIANNLTTNQSNQFSNKPSNLLSASILNTPISNQQTINAARAASNATPTIAKLIHSNSSQKLNSISIKTESSSSLGSQVSKICYVCTKTSFGSSVDQIMISCSSCSRSSHQVCLELNPELIDWPYIRSYPWQCMDCKKCSTCNNPHDEDKMMFCDRCDRGFHTYCVGVGEVPSGSWFCKTCSQSSRNTPKHYRQSVDGFDTSFNNTFSSKTPQENRTVVHGRRGRPPGSLNKPKDPNNPKHFAKLNKTKSGEFAMLQ